MKQTLFYAQFIIVCCCSFCYTNGHYINETSTEHDYKRALKYSLLFYESQRSGRLPPTNRIPWRANSALNDKGKNGEDLTGGYYDAGGDFVKFSYTMAFTTTILSWSVLSYKQAYVKAVEYETVLDAIKWSTDYFLKTHTSPFELYGQVGDLELDHKFWGRPEEMTMKRPAFKIDENHPGSDLAGEVSAALAAASLVFKNLNETYSNELLAHSIDLYEFGKRYKGLFQDVIPKTMEYYEFLSYKDDLCWAAIWLYKANRNRTYLNEALEFYKEYQMEISEKWEKKRFFYNDKLAGIQVLLANVTNSNEFKHAIENFCDYIIDEQERTPKGLIYIDKIGTLSHAANLAFVCLEAANLNISAIKYVNFAKEQLDYILGSKTRSFVVGYGNNFPRQPYHSASSCPDLPAPCGLNQYNSTLPNPQILYGALVSGPDKNDYYLDKRENFQYTEVTLDYNAGFQAVLAGIIRYSNKFD